MNLEQKMYTKVVAYIKNRFPTGWGGVAVIHTADDKYLISVAFETFNASVGLCIETGGCVVTGQKFPLLHL